MPGVSCPFACFCVNVLCLGTCVIRYFRVLCHQAGMARDVPATTCTKNSRELSCFCLTCVLLLCRQRILDAREMPSASTGATTIVWNLGWFRLCLSLSLSHRLCLSLCCFGHVFLCDVCVALER